jgi:hypothetical protein
MGRMAVVSGYGVGVSALWLAWVMPFAGVSESVVIAFVGGTFYSPTPRLTSRPDGAIFPLIARG